MIGRARGAATAVAVALLAPGCGSSGDAEDEVRAAYDEVRAAFAAGDLDGVCALLSRTAKRELGTIGHEQPTACWQDAARLADGMEATRVPAPRPPRIAAVRVEGDAAVVVAVLGRGSPTRVRFAREGGTWKLDRLFGTSAPPPEDFR